MMKQDKSEERLCIIIDKNANFLKGHLKYRILNKGPSHPEDSDMKYHAIDYQTVDHGLEVLDKIDVSGVE